MEWELIFVIFIYFSSSRVGVSQGECYASFRTSLHDPATGSVSFLQAFTYTVRHENYAWRHQHHPAATGPLARWLNIDSVFVSF